ncbi:MAG: CHAD domain-containing protein [Cobetia amphilecti]
MSDTRQQDSSPMNAALNGVIQARLDAMRERLAQPTLSAADVHALRVDCKQLRGWWQLRRESLGKSAVSEHQARPRAVAKALAGPREAHMLRKTHGRAYAWVDERSQRLLDALRPGLTSASLSEPEGELDHAPLETLLGEERAAWQAAPLTVEELNIGLEFSRHRISKLAAQVASKREIETSHRLRKWVKYRMFQLALAHEALGEAAARELESPSHGRRREPELLDKAAARLGNQHDLAELALWVGERVMLPAAEKHLVADIMTLADQRLAQALKPLKKLGYV